jgi:glycosyltransferase involved in cell wall biosynthesis
LKNTLLSIITINFNDAEGLQKTIESVVNQTWKDFEYLVIDGGSKDESSTVIENYKDNITYSVSEKDKGIYNAMNKGIEKATGEYVLFLNSGDYLNDESVLKKIFLENNFSEDLFYGCIKTVKNGKTEIKKAPETLTMDYLLNFSLPHPATFYKRALFEKFGYYNEDNKIVSDWEFNLKVLSFHNISYRRIDLLVSVFDLNGISSQPGFDAIQKKEGEKALSRIFSPILSSYILESLRDKDELKQLKNNRIIQWAMKIAKIKGK